MRIFILKMKASLSEALSLQWTMVIAQIIHWHQYPEELHAVGKQGLSVVKMNQGALKKLLTLIENHQSTAFDD